MTSHPNKRQSQSTIALKRELSDCL